MRLRINGAVLQAPVAKPSASVTVMPVTGISRPITGPWGTDLQLNDLKRLEHQKGLEKKWLAMNTIQQGKELAELYGQALAEDASREKERKLDEQFRQFLPHASDRPLLEATATGETS